MLTWIDYTLTAGRDTQKTQNGIETLLMTSSYSNSMGSRHPENPERD